MYTENSPLLAPALANPEQIVAYILSRPHTNYRDDDIRMTIVPTYFTLCANVGIDPVLAIAQMIHETGNLTSFWSARGNAGENPRRNPAGIGVDGTWSDTPPAVRTNWSFNPDRGRWEKGLGFASWANDAIPAHIGRLLLYTLPQSHANDAQRALMTRALTYRTLASAAWGSAQTLKQLGAKHNPANAGLPKAMWAVGWAWDGDTYGDKIAHVANAIR